MAGEDQDDDDKTQDATERRLEKALEDGNIPRSQDLAGFMVLAAGLASAGWVLVASARATGDRLAGFLAGAHAGLDQTGNVAGRAVGGLASVVAPVGLAAMLAAIAAGLVLIRPRLTSKPLMPKVSRISPMAGFKRIAGKDNLVQFAKTLVKLAAALGVLAAVLWPRAGEVPALADLADIRSLAPLGVDRVVRLSGVILALYLVIALFDAVFQVFSWKKRLRMTHHEVREEHKETEGNPEIKARLRQIRLGRARQRMMAAVPEATVIITNPTHYAVALKYEAGMAAPVCVAKGVDELAMRIRDLGRTHEVPIIENPPLARALHASADIDEPIPIEHYKAVAEVIGYVLRLSRRHSR